MMFETFVYIKWTNNVTFIILLLNLGTKLIDEKNKFLCFKECIMLSFCSIKKKFN